jgi:hypothetical protein
MPRLEGEIIERTLPYATGFVSWWPKIIVAMQVSKRLTVLTQATNVSASRN